MSCKMNGIETAQHHDGGTLEWFHNRCEHELRNSPTVRVAVKREPVFVSEKKSWKMTAEEVAESVRLRGRGCSYVQIGKALHRDPDTVSRFVRAESEKRINQEARCA